MPGFQDRRRFCTRIVSSVRLSPHCYMHMHTLTATEDSASGTFEHCQNVTTTTCSGRLGGSLPMFLTPWPLPWPWGQLPRRSHTGELHLLRNLVVVIGVLYVVGGILRSERGPLQLVYLTRYAAGVPHHSAGYWASSRARHESGFRSGGLEAPSEFSPPDNLLPGLAMGLGCGIIVGCALGRIGRAPVGDCAWFCSWSHRGARSVSAYFWPHSRIWLRNRPGGRDRSWAGIRAHPWTGQCARVPSHRASPTSFLDHGGRPTPPQLAYRRYAYFVSSTPSRITQ